MQSDVCEVHCWHDTGDMLMCDPPKAVQVCCMCGVKRSILISRRPGIPPHEHGPYRPLN